MMFLRGEYKEFWFFAKKMRNPLVPQASLVCTPMFDEVANAVDKNQDWLGPLPDMQPWPEQRTRLVNELVEAIGEAANSHELAGISLQAGVAAERILRCLHEVVVDKSREHQNG